MKSKKYLKKKSTTIFSRLKILNNESHLWGMILEKQIPVVFKSPKNGAMILKRSPLAICLMVFKNLMVSTIGRDYLAGGAEFPSSQMTGKLSVQEQAALKNLHFCLEGRLSGVLWTESLSR